MNAGALLYDVRDCSDERKDGAGIAKILSAAGMDIMGSEECAAEFGGWCIDGTKANRSAIRLLEVEHPTWVNTTCVAHGGALAIKDFCKTVKTAGRYSKTYGCQWIKDANEKANTIANYVQDSGIAKVIVHRHQQEIYGTKKAIEVSAPTRFGSHVFVQKGVQRSSAALKQAASDPAWGDLGGKSAQVCYYCSFEQGIAVQCIGCACAKGSAHMRLIVQVEQTIADAVFWDHLRHSITFLQPFSDFIHQIEADCTSLG